MPPEFTTPPEFPEPGRDVGQLGHSQMPNARVEAQLNQPADVNSAHQFFQARVDTGLPNVSLGDNGASAGLSQIPHGILPGGEHAMAAPAMVGDKAAALGAMLQPGADQAVNPLIQMIMKMPGLTGFMNDFFEFLKSFFEGDLLQSLTSALLDPTGLMLHLFQEAGDAMTLPVDMIKSTMPQLSFQNGMFMPGDFNGMHMHSDLLSSADSANVGAPIQNVDMQQAIFEKTSNYSISDYHQNSLLDWHRGGEQVAMGPDSGVYRPSMGSYQAPPATNATTGATTTTATTTPAAQHAPAHHAAAHHAPKHFRAHDVSTKPVEIAQAPTGSDAVGGQYTVQSGDSLWDIARHQLGDGSRWGEIYRMNADVIGQNPDLIHPGTTLQMPDANTVASGAAEGSKYIVQPGDNLWNIAKDHMGGGENWGNLYQMNQGVIGSNPGLIHPGQQLSLDGSAGAVAQAPTAASPVAAAQPAQAAASMPVAQAAQPSAEVMPTASTQGLQAQAPQVAPVEGNTFANSAGVGNEVTINSGTQVPANAGDNSQMYTAQDGSLFYRNKPQ